jgi:CSLREA domain-containing protein
MGKLIVLLIAAGLVSLVFSASALAAPIVVNSASDAPGAAGCTLREALASANADTAAGNGCADGSGADVISFSPGVFVPGGTPDTITLASQQLILDSDLSITGPGASDVVIDGAAGERTIFADDSNAIALSGVTVTGGDRTGTGNDQGGGIYNEAGMTLTRVAVTGNQLVRTAIGGSVTALGGGIYNNPSGTLTLNESVVAGNTASAQNTEAGLTGAEAYGGGILNESGIVRIHDSVIDDNHAIAQDAVGASVVQAQGGGVHTMGATTVDVDQTQITRNDATASAAAAGSTVVSRGAGFATGNGTITIEETTIAGNAVAASGPGSSITQDGGGIYNGAATLDLVSDTIARNGPSPTGAANIASGATTNLENTIVSDPLGAGGVNCGPGTENSGGFNVDYNAAGTPSCNLGVGELTSNPLLAAGLATNGGPTETIALLPASPAIDAGSNAAQAVPSQDQRGFLRPVDFTGVANAGNGTDIGAFEVQRACAEQTTPGGACPSPGGGPGAVAPPVIAAPATPTGERAEALKTCKKKAKKRDWSKKRLNRCKRNARKLPV